MTTTCSVSRPLTYATMQARIPAFFSSIQEQGYSAALRIDANAYLVCRFKALKRAIRAARAVGTGKSHFLPG